MADIPVQCCRCRNRHMESERVERDIKSDDEGLIWRKLVCSHCGAEAFYDLSPQVAWCWRSGLIEIGDQVPKDSAEGSGPIQIATGPKASLVAAVKTMARHGRYPSAGNLLVPGVPQAESQEDAGDALSAWLELCARRNGKIYSNGVVFAREGLPC